MAKVRAFSLGGLGGGGLTGMDPGGCCCGSTGCTLTVDTKWCSCVAPGTITVTVHSGTITGPVVCSGTANSSGLFVCTLTTAGTYVATASTTSGGYLNDPATIVITSAPTSGPCTPATVRTVIYPNQVTATGFWGTKVLSPTGGANLCESASSAFGYTGTVTGFSVPAACGCAATSMNIDFVFIPCGSFGQTQPWLIYCIDTYTQTVPPFQLCPGPDPLAPPQSFTSTTGNLSGTGPQGSGTTGFPVNLTGTYSFSFANDPRAILYGCCVSGTNSCSTGITLTQ
jgi:hypothetical protein